MKRLLVAVILALSLLTNVGVAEAPLPSVLPLVDAATGKTFCTAFSINQLDNIWASAGHCAAHAVEKDITVHLANRLAIPVYFWYDQNHDMAVWQAQVSAKAFKLAKEPPQLYDVVVVQGYPYGLPALIHTTGTVAARNVFIAKDAPISDILTNAIAGGNSGSPVLNKKGEVVGIVWGMFTQGRHAIAVPWEALKQNLILYWEK